MQGLSVVDPLVLFFPAIDNNVSTQNKKQVAGEG